MLAQQNRRKCDQPQRDAMERFRLIDPRYSDTPSRRRHLARF
jgi:hypothetical protein